MKRLYYLVDNLNTVEEVATALHREGISDWNFHVLSKDAAGLHTHHLHSATPLHQRDVIRTGERGALLGFGTGLLLAIFSVLLVELPPLQSLIVVAITIGLPTLFGAWAGGLVGLSLENYKIARFHSDIEAGRSLLMIDVDHKHESRVQILLQSFAVQAAGEDSTIVMPFRLSHA
jgi:hypothetical protein